MSCAGRRGLVRLGFLLLSLGGGVVGAQVLPGSEAYLSLYFRALSEPERAGLLARMVPGEAGADTAFYTRALEELLGRGLSAPDVNEETAKNDLALRLTEGLGALGPAALGQDGTAELLWRTYEAAPRLNVRLLALETLGRTGKADYGPRMLQALARLNLSERRSREDESLALALVRGLRSLNLPYAFDVLFAAAEGWYPPGGLVKTEARAAWAALPEPAAALTALIESTLDQRLRRRAFEEAAALEAPAPVKIRAAQAALTQGLRWLPADENELRTLAQLRQSALELLVRLQARDPELVRLYQRVLSAPGTSDAELLWALQALGVHGSEAAAALLSASLSNFNARQRSGGLTARELTLVRQLIQSLGQTGQASARLSLAEVEVSNYANAVVRLAQEALRRLP